MEAIINQLISNLNKLPKVLKVSVLIEAPKRLTFKIYTNYLSCNEDITLFDTALDLVIDAEWALCDLTESDNWHFMTEHVIL